MNYLKLLFYFYFAFKEDLQEKKLTLLFQFLKDLISYMHNQFLKIQYNPVHLFLVMCMDVSISISHIQVYDNYQLLEEKHSQSEKEHMRRLLAFVAVEKQS